MYFSHTYSSGSEMYYTVMMKVQQISEASEQGNTVITLDQQLYRVTVNIMWDNYNQFESLRLGGMHLLMSNCGCTGALNMTDTGIE